MPLLISKSFLALLELFSFSMEVSFLVVISCFTFLEFVRALTTPMQKIYCHSYLHNVYVKQDQNL